MPRQPLGRQFPAGAELVDRVRPITRRARRSLRQAVLARRRLLAASLAAAAVASGLQVLAPEPPDTVAVPVAAVDLAAGHLLTDDDVRLARWPTDLVPAGLGDSPIGSRLAAPVGRGEPITGARLLGPGLLLGQPPGTGSMAVRLTEPLAGLVRAGDRIDLIAGGHSDAASVPGSRGQAFVVVRGVLVLAVGGASPGAAADGAGGLLDAPGVSDTGTGEAEVLIVAANTADGLRIRAAADGRSLGVMVNPVP